MSRMELDRGDILPALIKRVEGFRAGYRQNVALLGEAGMGKTTLFHYLAKGPLRADPSLLPVYLESRKSENLVEWATRFVQTLFYASDSISPRLTSAARKILELAESGRSELAYSQIWDLPQMLSQDLGCRVVLLVDEFHRLKRLPVKDPFQVLGRKIMVQSSVLYLVSSSQPAQARKILREGLALLFGQFELLEVGSLGSSVCLSALRSAWPQGQTDPFCEFLVLELAQGRPDQLMLLLNGLRELQASEPASSPESVLLGLLDRLFLNPDSMLRQCFEAKLSALPDFPSRLSCVRLLVLIAGGTHRLARMAEAADRPVSQIRRFVQWLEREQLVVKEGTLVRVPERLFQLWLVAGYPALHGVGLADFDKARAHFRAAAAAWLERCRREFREPLPQRIASWMRQWANDSVEIDGRRVQLPRWKTLEEKRLACGFPAWEVRGGPAAKQKGWCVVLSEQPLSEQAACALVKELSRDSRKVFLSSCPVEINARLVLQQGRVKVWDPAVLNHLLALYGMTRLWLPEEKGGSSAGPVPVPPPFSSGSDFPSAEQTGVAG